MQLFQIACSMIVAEYTEHTTCFECVTLVGQTDSSQRLQFVASPVHMLLYMTATGRFLAPSNRTCTLHTRMAIRFRPSHLIYVIGTSYDLGVC